MSKVVSMRFKDAQIVRLQRIARRLGRTPSEAGALLVEEGLRRAEFGGIDFRDSAAGRQAYLQGSSLAVWEVVFLARNYEMDSPLTAEHLEWPVSRVQAALNYAAAFPDEIEAAIADNAAYDLTALSRMLPETAIFTVPVSGDKSSG
jgi:hypothetical protein